MIIVRMKDIIPCELKLFNGWIMKLLGTNSL